MSASSAGCRTGGSLGIGANFLNQETEFLEDVVDRLDQAGTVADQASGKGRHYNFNWKPFTGLDPVHGYKPADSRVFQPGEVAPTFDFALSRATPPTS